MIELESKLERKLICKNEIERELEKLGIINKERERKFDIMRKEMEKMSIQMCKDSQKIGELEFRLMRLEEKEKEGEYDAKYSTESGRGGDLIVLSKYDGEEEGDIRQL